MNLVYGIRISAIGFLECYGHYLIGIDPHLDDLIELLTNAQRQNVYIDKNNKIHETIESARGTGSISIRERLMLPGKPPVLLISLHSQDNYNLVAEFKTEIGSRLPLGYGIYLRPSASDLIVGYPFEYSPLPIEVGILQQIANTMFQKGETELVSSRRVVEWKQLFAV